jgi:hypothetical protein
MDESLDLNLPDLSPKVCCHLRTSFMLLLYISSYLRGKHLILRERNKRERKIVVPP